MKKGQREDLAEADCLRSKALAKTIFQQMLHEGQHMEIDGQPKTEDAQQVTQEKPRKEIQQVLKDKGFDDPNSEEDSEDGKGSGAKEAKFVIGMNSRATAACLHSRKGCYRGRRLSFSSYDLVYEDAPREGTYTTYCRVCFPKSLPTMATDLEESGSSEDNEETTSGSDCTESEPVFQGK